MCVYATVYNIRDGPARGRPARLEHPITITHAIASRRAHIPSAKGKASGGPHGAPTARAGAGTDTTGRTGRRPTPACAARPRAETDDPVSVTRSAHPDRAHSDGDIRVIPAHRADHVLAAYRYCSRFLLHTFKHNRVLSSAIIHISHGA